MKSKSYLFENCEFLGSPSMLYGLWFGKRKNLKRKVKFLKKKLRVTSIFCNKYFQDWDNIPYSPHIQTFPYPRIPM